MKRKEKLISRIQEYKKNRNPLIRYLIEREFDLELEQKTKLSILLNEVEKLNNGSIIELYADPISFLNDHEVEEFNYDVVVAIPLREKFKKDIETIFGKFVQVRSYKDLKDFDLSKLTVIKPDVNFSDYIFLVDKVSAFNHEHALNELLEQIDLLRAICNFSIDSKGFQRTYTSFSASSLSIIPNWKFAIVKKTSGQEELFTNYFDFKYDEIKEIPSFLHRIDEIEIYKALNHIIFGYENELTRRLIKSIKIYQKAEDLRPFPDVFAEFYKAIEISSNSNNNLDKILKVLNRKITRNDKKYSDLLFRQLRNEYVHESVSDYANPYTVDFIRQYAFTSISILMDLIINDFEEDFTLNLFYEIHDYSHAKLDTLRKLSKIIS